MPLTVKKSGETPEAPKEPAKSHFHSGTRERHNSPMNEADRAEAVANLLMGNSPDGEKGSVHARAPEDEGASEDGRSTRAPATEDGEKPSGLLDDVDMGDEYDPNAQENEGEQAPRKGKAPTTIAEAAEALGMEPKDLYKMELTTGDGETVTIGDLKDAYQNRQAAERETAERAAALDERETAIFQEHRLLTELGQDLEKALSPEKRQKLVQNLEARDARERQLLLDAMPELKDKAKFDQFRSDVVEALGKYGYDPHEIVVTDHRHLLIVRDLIRAHRRIKSLTSISSEQKPPKSAPPQGRGAGSQNKRRSKHVKSHGSTDQVSAVASLIKGN